MDSPYRPPAATVAEINPSISEQDVLSFTGNEYYWSKWNGNLQQGRWWTGFNWAAAFCSTIWFVYRRLYIGAAVAFFGGMLASALISTVAVYAFPSQIALAQTVAVVTSLLVVRVPIGIFANRLLLQRVQHAVNQLDLTLTPEQRKDALSAAGKTNDNGVWVVIVLIFAFNVTVALFNAA